jgi:FHA domain
MRAPDSSPHHPEDRKRLQAAEDSGLPFLVFRDREGAQQIFVLAGDVTAAVIGRQKTCDVSLSWDDRVSRTHAEIARLSDVWVVSDDGLSRNGTFVNEERVTSRRRLHDGDVIRAGHTAIVVRVPSESTGEVTASGSNMGGARPITPAQKRVLEALCAPCLLPGAVRTPATNEAIAAELVLSVDAVKAHLRQLFQRFELDALPQIQKRTALVRVAIESGIVRRSR